MAVPFLLAHVRLEMLIRTLLTRTWAPEAWPLFPKALRAAKVTGFRFHDLRHTFASRLAMERVELMAIRELMGHKSMAMTLRYSHLSPEHRRSAIERLVTRRTATDYPAAVNAE